jgi:hypothetical protein
MCKHVKLFLFVISLLATIGWCAVTIYGAVQLTQQGPFTVTSNTGSIQRITWGTIGGELVVLLALAGITLALWSWFHKTTGKVSA